MTDARLEGAKASEDVDGPNGSGYYTAGIDLPISAGRGTHPFHLHAIEFHDHDRELAVARRDRVLALILEWTI